MRSEIMDGILRHIHPSGGIENAKLLEVSPGHAKLSVEITQKALNLYGNVHGGFLFSLCDTAAGMSTYAYETANVTECSSINFLRGVNTGTIYIESNAIHKGRKTVSIMVCRHETIHIRPYFQAIRIQCRSYDRSGII